MIGSVTPAFLRTKGGNDLDDILLKEYVYPGETTALWISLSLTAAILLGFFSVSTEAPIILIVGALIYIRTRQGQLLGNSALVTSSNYVRVHQLVTLACDRINVIKPRVHIIQDPFLNAFSIGFSPPFSIVIHSAVIPALDDDELLFLIGHELTHIKRKHTTWLSLIAPFGKTIPGLDLIFAAWQRRTEYTCDRAGLITCWNLDAALSALIKVSCGAEALEYTDYEEFLKQAVKTESSRVDSLAELMGTHPYVTNRIKKLIEFFRWRIEQGPAGKPISTSSNIITCTNTQCQALLRIPKTGQSLKVICPKCHNQFLVRPRQTTGSGPSNPGRNYL